MHSASYFQINTLLKSFLFTLAILTIPLIGMLTTEEVNWDGTDFIVGGMLIYVFSVLFQMAHQSSENISLKVAYGIVIISTFLILWVNLAVGLIGSENEPFNFLYSSVLAVGIAGNYIAKRNKKLLAFTVFCMALTIVLIGIIALLLGFQHTSESSVFEIIAVTTSFTIPFILSGILFLNSHKKSVSV